MYLSLRFADVFVGGLRQHGKVAHLVELFVALRFKVVHLRPQIADLLFTQLECTAGAAEFASEVIFIFFASGKFGEGGIQAFAAFAQVFVGCVKFCLQRREFLFGNAGCHRQSDAQKNDEFCRVTHGKY